MTNPDEIRERVLKIISEHLHIDKSKIQDESNIIDDLGADSLDTVELVMAFEEDFGISMPDQDAERLQNVGDVIKYINESLA